MPALPLCHAQFGVDVDDGETGRIPARKSASSVPEPPVQRQERAGGLLDLPNSFDIEALVRQSRFLLGAADKWDLGIPKGRRGQFVVKFYPYKSRDLWYPGLDCRILDEQLLVKNSHEKLCQMAQT
jgi:hypothetical protein